MELRGRATYHRQLQALVGILVAGCLLYFPRSDGTFLADIPEIVIPIGITTVLALTSIWVHQQKFFSRQLREIVRYGWVGALISAITSIWWVALRRAPTVQVQSLSDELLTVWSLGIGAGILVGTYTAIELDSTSENGRKGLLAEVPWTGRSGPEPILGAVVEAIAEARNVDPLELNPIWEDIDPDLFSALYANGNAQWHLLFSSHAYEISVYSHGVVTVHDTSESTPGTEIITGSEIAEGQ